MRNNPINASDPTGYGERLNLFLDLLNATLGTLVSNGTGGIVPRPQVYTQQGKEAQFLTDFYSIVLGSYMTVSGGTAATTGGTVTLVSGGSTGVVTVPVAVTGLAVAGEGMVLTATAAANIDLTVGMDMFNSYAEGSSGGASPKDQARKKTNEGQYRQDQARNGDDRRIVDQERAIDKGRRFYDTETNKHVYIYGEDVVIVNQDGSIQTAFKNPRSNTAGRQRRGKWIPDPVPEPPPWD